MLHSHITFVYPLCFGTYRNLVQANIRAEFPSRRVPIQRIFRLSLSMSLLVRIKTIFSTGKCNPIMNYTPLKLQLRNNWKNRPFNSLFFRKHRNINHLEQNHLAVSYGEPIIVFQKKSTGSTPLIPRIIGFCSRYFRALGV